MTFRLRLLLTSLATLAVGLGVLLVAGNLLLQRGVRSEATALLRARADAQLAALNVKGDRLAVREPANDAAIDRLAWVMQGSRVVARRAAPRRPWTGWRSRSAAAAPCRSSTRPATSGCGRSPCTRREPRCRSGPSWSGSRSRRSSVCSRRSWSDR